MTTAEQAAQIAGGTWTIDKNHSLIEFAALHNTIAYVKGRFLEFSGTIDVNERDLLKSNVNLKINTKSVESQAVQGREDLINGEDLLDTARFPEIGFKSKGIHLKGVNDFVVTGDLTLRGTTREVQVPLKFNGIVTTRMGTIAGFSGNLALRLSDYGVPFAREFEPGKRVVGDELEVELQIEARPQAPAA
jgi:polyisoprenoid-binding protein YceI